MFIYVLVRNWKNDHATRLLAVCEMKRIIEIVFYETKSKLKSNSGIISEIFIV